MTRLVFGMNMSMDGYVDLGAFGPSPELFRRFVAETAAQTGSLYGLMRYWDEDRPGWGPDEAAFAAAWRRQPKWVVSRTLAAVGPNATLLGPDLPAEVRAIRDAHAGEIEVAGPTLAAALGDLDLIDEYRIYLHPVVLGRGTPFFARARSPLRLIAQDVIDGAVIRLRYKPESRQGRVYAALLGSNFLNIKYLISYSVSRNSHAGLAQTDSLFYLTIQLMRRKVISGLKIHPKLRRDLEKSRE